MITPKRFDAPYRPVYLTPAIPDYHAWSREATVSKAKRAKARKQRQKMKAHHKRMGQR